MRIIKGFVGALVGVACSAASGYAAASCVWGPLTDVPAAQAELRRWVAANGLPAFVPEKSGLSIEGRNVRLSLQFATGGLTLSWNIDEECNPTAVTTWASADYEGLRPDTSAVLQFANTLRTLSVAPRVETHSPGGAPGTVLSIALVAGIEGVAVAVGWLLSVPQRRSRAHTTARRLLLRVEPFILAGRGLSQHQDAIYRVTAALIVAGALLLRWAIPVGAIWPHPDVERLFILSLPPWENLLHCADQRHPCLWAITTHYPMLWSNYSPAVVLGYSRVFGVLAVILAGALVRRQAGPLPAVLAMAGVALSPMLAEHCQAASDPTLAVSMALAALFFYSRAGDSGRLGYRLAFAVTLFLAMQSSFACVMVAAAIGTHALLNRERFRRFAAPLFAVALLTAASTIRVLDRVVLEFPSTQAEHARFGALANFGGFLTSCGNELFGDRVWPLVVPLLSIAMGVSYRRLSMVGPVPIATLFVLFFLGLYPVLNISPQYGFLLPVCAARSS